MLVLVAGRRAQVRKGAGPKGEDVSVPISATYNHHYGVNMIGQVTARPKRAPANNHTTYNDHAYCTTVYYI